MGYGNISGAMTAEVKAKIKQSMEGIKTDMPFLVNLTSAERQKLRTIGPNRLSYVTEVNLASNAHKPALAADFSLSEFNSDKQLLTDLTEVYSWLSPLCENLESTIKALGAEVMKHTDEAYGYLKVHAKKNNNESLNAALKRISDLLKQSKKDDKKA